MHLVQTGDGQAYQLLFTRYKDPVWSYVFRRVRDQQSASEIYQEVFLRVWRFAKTFQSGSKVRPWIYRIASNVIKDQYRKSTREITTTTLEGLAPSGRLHDPIATHDLEKAIDQLPETLKEAFLLGALQGLDHKEVADALGISPANARARVSRARVKLRELLRTGGAQ